MRSIKIILVILLAAKTFCSYGQQIPLNSAYVVNNMVLNPAAAGEGGQFEIYGIGRDQYSGFEGSPNTQMIMADGLLEKEKVGLGLRVFNEQSDILGNTGISLTYSYKVKLGENLGLSFGVSGVAGQRSIDFDKVIIRDTDEDMVFDERVSQFLFDADAGMLVNFRRLTLGVAVPQVFGNKWDYENRSLGIRAEYNNIRHFIGYVKYPVSLKKDILELEPLVLIRAAENVPVQSDINLKLHKVGNWYLNAGYRSGYAVSVGGGFYFSEKFLIGYNYDKPVNEISRFTSGSHEIVLGLIIGAEGLSKRSRGQKNTGSGSPLPVQSGEDYNRLNEKVRELEKMNQLQKEELEIFKTLLRKNDAELDSLRKFHQKEEELKKQEEAFERNGMPAKPQSGMYMNVLGSFTDLENALQFRRLLVRLGTEAETRVTRSASGKWFFVYTGEYENKEEALKKLEELEHIGIILNSKPWLYKAN